MTETTSILGEDEALFATYVGPNWERYYRARFQARAAGQGPWAWNWAAALVPFWMSFRRLQGALVIYGIASLAIVGCTSLLQGALGQEVALVLSTGLVPAVLAVLQGGFANAVYFSQAGRAVNAARRRYGADATRTAQELARKAPRLGGLHVAGRIVLSTLLLVILGLIVLFLLPHHHDRSLAYRAAMKSDLRNLVTAEEAFATDSQRYTASLEALLFAASAGVHIRVDHVSAAGWHATATHLEIGKWICEIFIGAVPDTADGAAEGVPECRRTAP